MSYTAKMVHKPILFLFLATFSLASFGQELDSLKSSKKVLDRLELETSLSLFESQAFKSIPGAGVQVAVFAPFFNGGLRLGIGVGFSKLRYRYEFDTHYNGPLGYSAGYTSNLDIYPLNVDLTVGTDFLRKSDMDLVLDIGARMYVPLYGTYSFDHSFYYDYPQEHSFEVRSTILPSALGRLSFKFPIGKRSALSISYGFNYTFLKFRPKTNTSSNGIYYQPDRLSELENHILEDYLVAIITEPGVQYNDQQTLELPSHIGGQHSISIGYCHTFGMGKKTE